MDKETIEIMSRMSIAFSAGVEAARINIPLKQSVITKLMPGTPEYDDFLCGYDSIKKKSERRIMKNEEIESLITSTITHIKAALDKDKPGEAKVYTDVLFLLRQTQNISSPNWEYNKDKTYNKPFEKISDKHIPDV